MRNSSDTERYVIKQCKQDIIEKFFGIRGNLFTHSDFLKLSEEIYMVSKTSISLSTLKRFMNKDYEGLPNISTLDAFAVYLGYNSWNDYRRKRIIENGSQEQKFKKRFYWNKKYLIIGLAIIFSGIFIYGLFTHTSWFKRMPKYEFSYTTNDINTIPQKVAFKFKIENRDFKSIRIQPYGHNGDAFDVLPTDSARTFTYFWPGLFWPKLLVDGEVVKVLKLDIKTNIWKASASKIIENEWFCEYYPDSNIFTGGSMYISKEILKKNNFPLEKVDKTFYCQFKDFKSVDGDNLHFETKIRNNYLAKTNNSGEHRIVLIFENGIIDLPVTEKSYPSSCSLILFDQQLNSNTNIISFLYINKMKWNTIRINTLNKQLELFINDRKVYSTKYSSNPGQLKGIEYIFSGLGEVDYVWFYNSENKLIYFDEFN